MIKLQLNNLRVLKVFLWVVLILLLLSNVILGAYYYAQSKEVKNLQSQLRERQVNEKVVNFLSLFVKKVLKAKQEVSFEDRLQLENAARDIGDSELLLKWVEFTEGVNESQIQNRVKDLLEALVSKIVIN